MPKSTSHFKNEWLTDDRYRDWVIRGALDTEAKCLWCKSLIIVSTMGVKALESHMEGKKHKSFIKARADAKVAFSGFRETSPPESSKSAPASQQAPPTLDQLITSPHVINAEILWCLKVVMSHMSFRSCLGLNDMFKTMFSDSAIAHGFALSKTKCAYALNFGIAPYYRELLVAEVKLSPFYVLAYDESMNKVLQSEQMDCGLRFWDENEGIVKARYFDSKFLQRPNAQNLLDKLVEVTDVLGIDKILQLSMDGPRVNWNVLKMLQEKRKENDHPGIIDIGSCGLHVIHGAFQTGLQSQGWELNKIFRGMFNIFNESPARREVYTRISESSKFAFQFCATRWVEDEMVAQRGMEIWPNFVKVVKHWESQCKSSRPDNKSYETLVKHHQDVFVPLKMEFFRHTAKIFKEFLVQFQTDAPMVPFLAHALERQMRKIAKIVIKRKVLKDAKTPYSLMKIDLDKEENRRADDDIELGTALKEMLSSPSVRPERKREFKRQCKLTIISVLKKLNERSPLNFAIVRNASSLMPQQMIKDKEASIIRFKSLAEKLSKLKLLSSDQCDKAKEQYEEFVDDECVKYRETFSKFDHVVDSLDKFLGVYLHKVPKYECLWIVCKIVFVLSHGQAAIERGYSVNEKMLDDNMKSLSITSLRMVYDHITSNKIQLSEYVLSSELLKNVKLSHQRYVQYLERNKAAIEMEKANKKRKSICDEIIEIKRQKKDLQQCINALNKDADQLSLKAEEKKDFTLLAKANAFRNKSKEKETTISDLDEALENLEKSKKKAKK